MKILSFNQEPAAYEKMLKQIKTVPSTLVIWQLFPENSKRVVQLTQLLNYDLTEKLITLAGVNDFLDPSLPLFFYVEDERAIFKASIKDINEGRLITLMPQEIKLMADPELEELRKSFSHLDTKWKGPIYGGTDKIVHNNLVLKHMSERSTRDQDYLNREFAELSLDEEEKLFADKRESPRVRPKMQKLVKVMIKGESEINFFDLFDLSRGGMSFVTTIPDKYPKGTDVLIVGFDAFDLDDPLYGSVASHRPLDDSEFDVKVGIKFLEGQD